MRDQWGPMRMGLVELGQQVADKRKDLGLSQTELLLAIHPEPLPGWNTPVVSLLEQGKYVPGAFIGARLSEWLLQSDESVVGCPFCGSRTE